MENKYLEKVAKLFEEDRGPYGYMDAKDLQGRATGRSLLQGMGTAAAGVGISRMLPGANGKPAMAGLALALPAAIHGSWASTKKSLNDAYV